MFSDENSAVASRDHRDRTNPDKTGNQGATTTKASIIPYWARGPEAWDLDTTEDEVCALPRNVRNWLAFERRHISEERRSRA